jgi:hypothetical protein
MDGAIVDGEIWTSGCAGAVAGERIRWEIAHFGGLR